MDAVVSDDFIEGKLDILVILEQFNLSFQAVEIPILKISAIRIVIISDKIVDRGLTVHPLLVNRSP